MSPSLVFGLEPSPENLLCIESPTQNAAIANEWILLYFFTKNCGQNQMCFLWKTHNLIESQNFNQKLRVAL